LPSALAGIITVGLLYLIGKEIRDQETGLVAAFVLAISPWAIQFSRGGWEVNLAMTLIVAGATLLLYARKRPWLLLGSVICFALSMYTYHAARLFAPMIGGIGGFALLIYYWKKQRRGIGFAVLAFVLTLIMVSPLVLNLQNKSVSSRFSDTSIFSNPQPVLDSNAAIAAHGNTRLSKLLYHRYWYYGAIVLQQWASHFSPTFLFVRGDGNYRHGGWTGLFYPLEGAFIGVTLCVLILQSLQKISNFKFQISKDQKLSAEYWSLIACIIWICLAAVPPALVTPAPHALRDLFAVPAYAILIAVGIVTVVKLFPIQYRRYVIGLIAVGYIFFGTSYFSQYLTIYPVKAQSDWQYGYEALYRKLAMVKRPATSVLTGSPRRR
jgi:4-amino-4-deoxy-L-arabinose transferase-like glycosyltransferase